MHKEEEAVIHSRQNCLAYFTHGLMGMSIFGPILPSVVVLCANKLIECTTKMQNLGETKRTTRFMEVYQLWLGFILLFWITQKTAEHQTKTRKWAKWAETWDAIRGERSTEILKWFARNSLLFLPPPYFTYTAVTEERIWCHIIILWQMRHNEKKSPKRVLVLAVAFCIFCIAFRSIYSYTLHNGLKKFKNSHNESGASNVQVHTLRYDSWMIYISF